MIIADMGSCMGKFEFDNPRIIQYDYHLFPDDGKIFPSLQELMDFLAQFDTSGCYFRGQSGLWKIVSSLFRHSGTPRFEKAQFMAAIATRLLKENPYIYNAVQNNDHYALAIAQHYGCPTDLVDVTTSLRVAGYFAASENISHQEQPLGCIWVFTEHDIQMLQQLLSSSIEGGSGITDYVSDALDQNSGSLLLKLKIPQLSRLNAQKGAFLWDVGGSLHDLIRYSGYGSCFVFRHTPGEKEMFSKDVGILFPLPNKLESEIMRIFTEKGRKDGLPEYIGPIAGWLSEHTGVTTNGLLTEMVEQSKDCQVIPFPDYFTPSCGEYPWERQTLTHSNVKTNDVNPEEYVDCYLPFNLAGVLPFVQDVLTRLENENLVSYRIVLIDKEDNALFVLENPQSMVHMIIHLNNYAYSQDEVAQVLLEYLRMLCFMEKKQFHPQTEAEYEIALISGQINDLVKAYYGCPVTKLNLYETEGYVTFWLPSDYLFLDTNCSREFERFDKSCFTPPDYLADALDQIPENARIFLYQHNPRKIISYECMKQMFIRLVLPQLFAFRRKSERVYIPDYVTGISLPYFGRPLFSW